MTSGAVAVGAAVAGGTLVYAGVRGYSIPHILRDIIAGSPPVGPADYPIKGNPASAGTATGSYAAAGSTGSSIADDALRYKGHAYVYGGAPGPAGTNPWDCSSFINWVLGHDLAMTLPGSSSPGYTGAAHGPTTLSYLAWNGAQTIGHNPASAEAGDLCVWQSHIGIALGGGQMISALDPQLGTQQTSIPGGAPGGELLYVRRILSVPQAGPQPGPGGRSVIPGG